MTTEIFCSKCNSPNPKDTVFCGKCGTRIAAVGGDTATEDPLLGTFVGDRFLVHEKLGEGGMGVVYRAEQTAIKREVALKVLHSNLTQDESLYARFQNEAAACSRLNHPNTITIYDFGKTALNSLYIAMEFIGGTGLDTEIQRVGAMDVVRACRIAVQICGSLQDAHNNSIIHRDLKPENVMLCERGGETDVVKVLDFGIAKIMEDETQDQRKALTKTGMVFGTPQYMSPEQIRGEPVDHRTDIYSLGVMLYQMLTGELPFTADTPMGLLTKHLMDPPPDLTLRGVPASVASAVMAALQKEAAARPQSMRAFAGMLTKAADEAGAGTAVSAAATTVPQAAIAPRSPAKAKAPKKDKGASAEPKRFPAAAIAIAALILAGGGAAAWYFTAGPGSDGASAVPISATPAAPALPPQTPASLPPQAPPAGPTTVPSTPTSTPATPVATLPSAPLNAEGKDEGVPPNDNSSKKDRGRTKTKGTAKKPDATKTPKQPDDKGAKDSTPPDDKAAETPTETPAKEAACAFSKPKEASGRALAGALRRQEKGLRKCATSDGLINAAFKFNIDKGASKVSGIQGIGGKGDSCIQSRLEAAVFKAQPEAAKGIAAVVLNKTGGVIDRCEVKVRILPPVKNLKDLIKGATE